jgi:hypothetical protein
MARTIVVDEVRNSDAEQGAFQSRIQSTKALAIENTPHRLQHTRMRLLRLDLRSRRQSYQRISVYMLSTTCGTLHHYRPHAMDLLDQTNVIAMASNPPPAPESAWATLSLCWIAAGEFAGAFWACA